MDSLGSRLQVTLRERRKVVLLCGLWVVLSLLCAVAGPFGTIDALGFGGRLAYWGVAVGISVLSSALPVLSRDVSWPRQLATWSGYVVALTVVIFGLNALVFEGWWGLGLFFYLLGVIGLTVLAINVAIWLIDYTRAHAPAPQIDAQARFLRRLPLANRAPLVRIEAQDHYLKVVTTRGSALILMRLGEAARELEQAGGLLVHRSHWVALSGVKAHRREKGRDMLLMSDGTQVPVSRSNRTAAREAGLF